MRMRRSSFAVLCLWALVSHAHAQGPDLPPLAPPRDSATPPAQARQNHSPPVTLNPAPRNQRPRLLIPMRGPRVLPNLAPRPAQSDLDRPPSLAASPDPIGPAPDLLDTPAPLDLPDPILEPPATPPAPAPARDPNSPDVIPLEPLNSAPQREFWSDRPPILDQEPLRESERAATRPSRSNRNTSPDDDPTTLDRAERNKIQEFAEESIRDALGRQIRSLDVEVDSEGRIDVRLRTRWPWQRRNARRTIENLPFAAKHELRVLSD